MAMPVQIEAIFTFRCVRRREKGASREGSGARPGDHLKPFCAGPLVAAADWLAALRIIPSTHVSPLACWLWGSAGYAASKGSSRGWPEQRNGLRDVIDKTTIERKLVTVSIRL
jgi:hypothetical protein